MLQNHVSALIESAHIFENHDFTILRFHVAEWKARAVTLCNKTAERPSVTLIIINRIQKTGTTRPKQEQRLTELGRIGTKGHAIYYVLYKGLTACAAYLM